MFLSWTSGWSNSILSSSSLNGSKDIVGRLRFSTSTLVGGKNVWVLWYAGDCTIFKVDRLISSLVYDCMSCPYSPI